MERDCQMQGYALAAGCDEVGRGAWAGPLVAAAVIFPPELVQALADPQSAIRNPQWAGLAAVRDSKQLLPAQRERLDGVIRRHALAVGLGQVSPGLGDRIGWGAANRLALVRAVRALPLHPDYLLLDAFGLPGLDLPQLPLIRGDSRCMSIAAASIIAKVARDRQMVAAGLVYPAYAFALHKGYGTPTHAAALARHGPSPIHRRSFAPVRERGMLSAECGLDEEEVNEPMDDEPALEEAQRA
jgi:ribonuclease HII